MRSSTLAGLTLRPIEDDEVDAFRTCVMTVFGYDPADDPQGSARFRALVDRQRAHCAFDGRDLVATSAAFELGLSIPGSVVPMAGLTMVTVRPTHRRRGILRALIERHLQDAKTRGEPLSGLWSSEAPIYGRFGYGVAAESDELTVISRGEFATECQLDDVIQLDEEAANSALPVIYTSALRIRPGMFTRSAAWWQLRRFADRPDVRAGRSPRVHVVSRRGAESTGYVTLRKKLGFHQGRAAGAIDVEELVALDGAAEATLWRYLRTIDLYSKISWWNAPTDTGAPWLASDRRAVTRERRADTLWLRICDIDAALTARRYPVDGSLCLHVNDPFRTSESTHQLTVTGGVAVCTPTTRAPDLTLDLPALGSIYLAGVSVSLLARVGAIRGAPEAVRLGDRMFAWTSAPWCPELF